ncbi:MAG: hypothetical protein AMXMBFR84_10970 [Candidatus Hydrogenedentota bacterium]
MGLTSGAVDVSVVIACYNEEGHLRQSVQEILEILDATRWTYEIIFVEDCSTDSTRGIVESLLTEYPDKNLQAIFHENNTGRGRTVSDGFRAAKGDVVGYLDIDLEVHARYIPSCVLAILNGADVAVGWREYRLHVSLFHRHVLSRGYVFVMQRMLALPLHDTESGFKFFRRERLLPVLDEVMDPGWFWDTEVMARSHYKGYAISEIPCLFIRRSDKKSTVRVIRDSIDYFSKLRSFRKELLKSPASAAKGLEPGKTKRLP